MKRSFYAALGAALISVAFAATALAAEAGVITVCTGAEGNPYYRAAETIAKFTEGIKIVPVATTGTFDNISRTLNGECQAYIGQPDGTAYLARTNPGDAKKLRKIGVLHREYAHLICSQASGVDEISDLDETKSIALGKQGSGAWLVWQNWIYEDDGYANIPVRPEADIMALTAVSTNQTSCLLVTAGVGNRTALEANNTFYDTVQFAEIDDGDFNDTVDIDGSKLYEFTDLPKDLYGNLIGWSDVGTVSWRAGVYINTTAEIFQDERRLSEFLTAVSRSRASIVAEFGG